MKKSTLFILFIFILLIFSGRLFSQTEVIDTTKNIILLKEMSGGVIFHTQGWGAKFTKGYNKSDFSRRVWNIELIEMRSPKQIRTINPYFTNSKSYNYGKLNSVFILRGAYGTHKRLNRKPYWGGVELRFLYMGGLSLGFAKPVYLIILKQSSQYYEYTTSEERYDPNEHFVDNIFGRASFTKGFGEIDVYPGIHAKVGLDFEYGTYSTKTKSLEIGAILDIFPRPVPIMAFNEPNYFFFTFYLNFNFGKRYNSL
jgi:hypothetical protein